MHLNYFQPEDKPYVMKIEPHINEQQYAYRLYTKTGYIIWKENNRAGLMYYSVLWDNLPFLNLIFIEDKYRKQGKSINRAGYQHQYNQCFTMAKYIIP